MFRFLPNVASALCSTFLRPSASSQTPNLAFLTPFRHYSPLLEQCRNFAFSAPNLSEAVLSRTIQKPRPVRANQPCDRKPIKGFNYRKAIVLKVFVKHPKKPNSGNRQCALVKLVYNGRETVAYIPGEGHNLQEHSQVLVRGGRRRDLIGVRSNIIRGKLDCAEVKKKTQ